MKLDELLNGTKYNILMGTTNREINSVAYDSRKCGNDSLFIAIKGTQTDGHDYINELITKGISAIICEDAPKTWSSTSETTIIQVENSRLILAQISKNWYKNPLKDIKVIGITGTNGKTTITYLLKSIFEKSRFKTGIIGTTGIFTGNEFEPATHTTPESLELYGHFNKMREDSVEYIFMEVSSHALHQNRVASIDFDCAIFTNLTHEHLDYHKTMDDYASAKKILFNMLNESGKAIVNGDDKYGELMLSGIEAKTKIRTGRAEYNDYRIISESLSIDKMEFSIRLNGKIEKFTTPMIGRFNIDNCAFAIAVSIQYGIPLETIQNSIACSVGAPGRMQRIKLKNNAIGIVDYSHTPDALEKALLTCREILNSTTINSKLICVFGCGGDRDKTKRPLMGQISSSIADFTIITDDNPRTEQSEHIIADILVRISEDKPEIVKVIPNRKDAIEYAVGISNANDIILVAGKGHENYQIYGKVISHFDDVEELSVFS